MDTSFHTRVVSTTSMPSSSSAISKAGTQFREALAQVRRIDAPLSPALNLTSGNGALESLMAQQQKGQHRLNRMMSEAQRKGSTADVAPRLALAMIDQSLMNDITAKVHSKCCAAVMQVCTST